MHLLKKRISLSDFRDEMTVYTHFSLELDDAIKTIGMQMDYDKVSVYLSTYPCISLRNENGLTVLKHICSVEKQEESTDFNICCKELQSNGRYIFIDYFLHCS